MEAVDKLTIRRFGEGSLAQESSTYVLEYLSEDDWKRCSSFQGKSNPRTFLVSLTSNAIEEFSRKRFGRPRPPSWLQELGESWIKLWRGLCLERQPLAAIVDRFTERGFRLAEDVVQAAKVIKARIPSCGLSSRDTEGVEDIDGLSDSMQTQSMDSCGSETPEFENPFMAELIMMIQAVTDDEPDNDNLKFPKAQRYDALASRYADKLQAFKSALELSDQEKIMLRMIHVEGLSKTATSKALGLPAHATGRIVNEALTRIAQGLQDCGLELDSLLDLN